jgi:hypothetical protein
MWQLSTYNVPMMSSLDVLRADNARQRAYEAMSSYLMPRGPIPVLPFDLEMNPMTAPTVDKPLTLPIKLLADALKSKESLLASTRSTIASYESSLRTYRATEASYVAEVDALKKALKKLGHKV